MLQNERFGTDLKKFISYAKIIDQSKTSDQYFRLFDVPEKLYLGKNSFRIRVNKDTLAKGALVYIDIVDANGGIIFHEVSQLTGEDGSRLIVVHIYEDTPPGEATIYLGSRATYDVKNNKPIPYSNDPSSTDFIDFPNIIWAGKVVVIPTAQTNNEIIFADAPKVKIQERFEQFLTNSGGENRKVFNSGSWSVTIQPTITAYEYTDKSKFAPQLNETSANVILDPRIEGGQAESNQKLLPLYSELTVLKDEVGNFTDDYVGGEIIIRGLDSQISDPSIDVPDFSCSIVEVLDSKTVKVTPPFKFLYGDKESKLLSSIKNATNVTASYYSRTQQLTTKDSESFIQIELENVEPIAGAVDSVKLSYKPYGSFGEFVPIGEFKIPEQEYLVDSSSLVLSKTELIERPIGKPSGSAEFDTYWDTINGKYAVETQNSGSFTNQGVYFRSKGGVENDTIDYDYKFAPKSAYGIRAVANTEFKLSFYTNFEERRDTSKNGQIDIFISGSSVLRATINERTLEPPTNPISDGTHISSIVVESEKSTEKQTIYFKTLSDGVFYPTFFVKNCSLLGIKDISITARNEAGFSPNQAKLFVPLTTLKTDTEIVLNVEYLSKTKESSKIESKVYGLSFSGSGLTPSIVDTGLSGSPVFNAVSQSISVQTSGSSLYSTDPATSGFSAIYGVFLGSNAGQNASAAHQSIFIGQTAGYSATNASGSHFIGVNAGAEAINAHNSTFIGRQSGYNASSAYHSNFIGYQAGDTATNAYYSNFIGREAGRLSINADNSNFIGYKAGTSANGAQNSNFIGLYAGYNAASGSDSNFIGSYAGYQAGNNTYGGFYSNFIGAAAGYQATNAFRSNFIGIEAGYQATNAEYSNFIGSETAYQATNAYFSNIIGVQAGYQATNANNSVFIGSQAGKLATHASRSIMLGYDAGANGTNSARSVFIGDSAGAGASSAYDSIYMGYLAGNSSTFANRSVFIGREAGYATANANLSVFVGFAAGSSAPNAERAFFMGASAGAGATNANNSTFLGNTAGNSAKFANNSVFIGNESGYNAVSASYSILIGNSAGAASTQTNTIGSNNTIIGNGISVPINANRALNINGLIFGTGSYAGGTVSSGSANGRIGINQPTPQYSLDVSGSGNYTNNLHVTGGLLVTQSYISTVDYIDFTKDIVTSFAEGRIHWDDDRKTLQVDTETNNFSISAGHVNVLRGRNTNSFTLTKGTVVYVNGNSGQFATFATASYTDESDSAYTIGIVAQNISANQYGYAVIQGEITGINTNGFTPGTLLYLSSSGQYTDQVPVAPNHTVRLGQVVVASTSGILQVKVDNGYEIGELHNVLESNKQNGDLLIYDSGSGLYRNSKILSGSYGVSGSLIVSGGITGSLFGTASYQSVKTSGSTLYSEDPSTSNFNKSESIFLGLSAGLNATSAYNSIFLGKEAGAGATSAYYSHFVGTYAGNGATNARYSFFTGYAVGENASSAYESIFIGTRAGASAQNSNNSVYIGTNAGRVSSTSLSPGENNIVIGTGITVAASQKNKVNIGALIFGSGSVLNTSNPYSGSANGKVGINQPDPQTEFDISGSIRISRLSTLLTARTTTGTTKMVITDENGDLSFQNTPSSFPYTGSAQITGSLGITGSLSITSGLVTFPYTSQNASYTVAVTDYFIEMTGGSTITLPSAITNPGRVLVFKNSTNSSITINPAAFETIDGAASTTLATKNTSKTIISNGSNWLIISQL